MSPQRPKSDEDRQMVHAARCENDWQSRSRRRLVPVLLLWFSLLAAGCDRLDMYDQPRYEPLEASKFFGDGLSARPPVEGTIRRGGLREDLPLYTGKEGQQFVGAIPDGVTRAFYDRHPQRFTEPFDDLEPIEVRQALLTRGRERFDIYCSVCHGRTGDGDGMIVRRGFRRPPSYHTDRLRQAASGYFYDVITNGFGSMASFANRIDVEDRWAIVAYVRALQLSQNAQLEDLSAEQRDALLSPLAGDASDQPRENAP
jgi:mono/diheme cytochrome c family protein